MTYLGDFALGATIDCKFCTVQSSGAPTTLAGTPVISAYLDNNTTQLTAGITLTVDFDGVTGLHNVRVVASGGNGYATATNYQLVITTGTVNAVSVVGYVVAQFSIENRIVASVTGNVGGNVTGSIGSLGATAKSDVNAEVLDVMTVDTFAEPSGVVGATATLKDMLNWVKVLCRNKITQSATTQTLRNNADAGDIATATVSDTAGTATRGKWT